MSKIQVWSRISGVIAKKGLLDNSRQNIWKKVNKPTKIEQNCKSLKSNFPCFFADYCKRFDSWNINSNLAIFPTKFEVSLIFPSLLGS